MFCRNCGRELDAKHKFCPGCGERVEVVNADEVTGKSKHKKNKFNFKLFISFLIFLTLVLCIVLAAFYMFGQVKTDQILEATERREHQDNLSENAEKESEIQAGVQEEAGETKGVYLAPVQLGEQWYIINDQDEVTAEVENSEKIHGILRFSESGIAQFLYFSSSEYLKGYINDKGKMIAEYPYYSDTAGEFFGASEYFGYMENEKWGYVNRDGELIIEPEYEDVRAFTEGMAAVKKNEKWGYVEPNGKLAIEPQYEEARDFVNGLAGVKMNGNWGFIDGNGEIIIPCAFSEVGEFDETGIVRVEQGDKCGFIDKSGNPITEIMYDCESSEFYKGLAKVKRNERYGYIDTTGQEVIPCIYSGIGGPRQIYEENLTWIVVDDKCGFVDRTGEIKIEPQYTYAKAFSNGMAVVGKIDEYGKNRKGMIDKQGNIVIDFLYDDIDSTTGDLIPAALDEKWGVIDREGNQITEFIYDDIDLATGDLISAMLNEKWGVIDREGNQITEFIYDNIEIIGDFIMVEKNEKYGMIDKRGKEILDIKYDGIDEWGEKYFRVEMEDGVQIVDEAGNEILDEPYDFIVIYSDESGLYSAQRGEKYGWINAEGEVIIDFKYDEAGFFAKVEY